MGRRGAPELELLAVVIVLFAPILHETITNSNFDTNTIWQLSHGSSFKCRNHKSISRQKYFADCFIDWHNILNEDVHEDMGHFRLFDSSSSFELSDLERYRAIKLIAMLFINITVFKDVCKRVSFVG